MIKMASGDISQIIKTQLKCYGCGSGPRAGKPHWYKCFSSHQICENCNGYQCKCGDSIIKEHCKFIEALLKSMRFNCVNQSRGCQGISGEEAMIFHEQECIFRLVKCPRIGCQWKAPFHTLTQHMKDSRECVFKQYSILKGNKQMHETLKMPPEAWDGEYKYFPVAFESDGRIFYSLIQKRSNQTFYHWIQFLGSPNEAKNYAYTLEYYANDASQRTCVYTDQVIPVDETCYSIISSYKCFAITFGMMKARFMDKDGKFNYSVQIRNLKEEVKDENVESGVSDVSDDE